MWGFFNIAMRIVTSLIGLCMVLMGGIWILQGLNMAFPAINRGFMVGNPQWALYGVILALVGAGQIVWANTRG